MAMGFNSEGLVGLTTAPGSGTPPIGTYRFWDWGLSGSYISVYHSDGVMYKVGQVTVGASPSSVSSGNYQGCFSYRYA